MFYGIQYRVKDGIWAWVPDDSTEWNDDYFKCCDALWNYTELKNGYEYRLVRCEPAYTYLGCMNE